MATRDVTSTMMHRWMIDLFWVLATILLAIPGLAMAQSQGKPAYSWEKCVEMVKDGNAELRSARAKYLSLKEAELGAAGGFYPTINATLDGTRSKAEPDDTNYSANLRLSQNLFDGMQDLAKTREAKAKTAVEMAKYEIARAKVSFELKSSFQHLVYATEYVKLSDEIVSRRQNNMRLVELRFQGGRENRGSVALSKAYLAEAKLDSLKARNSIMKARAHLARSLGLDDDESVQVVGEIPMREPGAEPNFRELALATPDHRRTLAEQNEAEQKIDIARSGFWPKLSLSGSYGRQGQEVMPAGDENWTVGVNLTLPLFNGFRDYSASRVASQAFAEKDYSRMNVARESLSKLRTAYSDYLEAVAKLKVDQSFRDAAALRAEIARSRYNNGLLSFEDWDGIENDLINRQRNYLEAKRERILKEAAWEQAQGLGAVE